MQSNDKEKSEPQPPLQQPPAPPAPPANSLQLQSVWASRPQVPAYVWDARTCLADRGFAFLPVCSESLEFTLQLLSGLNVLSQGVETQPIRGGGEQILMPGVEAHPEAHTQRKKALDSHHADDTHEQHVGAPAVAAAACASAVAAAPRAAPKRRYKSNIPQYKIAYAERIWGGLKSRWHALVLQVARKVGFTEEELLSYHVQDEKVRTRAHSRMQDVRRCCSDIYSALSALAAPSDPGGQILKKDCRERQWTASVA